MLYSNNLKTIIIISFVLIFFSAGCNNKTGSSSSRNINKLDGSISITGAFALYPLAQKWAEEFMKLNPDVKIDISAGGAGKGMADVLNGMVDLAMFSKEITSVERKNGAWWVAVVKDAVFGIVNDRNPFLIEIKEKGLTKIQLYDIFVTNKINSWSKLITTLKDEKINLFIRSDACGAAEMWAKYLGKQQEDLKGIGVYGDPGISDAVKKDIYAIGFNNLAFIFDIKNKKKYDGLEIIPLDLNENGKIDPDENFYGSIEDLTVAIGNNHYPSPPSRELYFVSKGKPDNIIVIGFLKWILTDGQKYVSKAGYVMLPDNIIKNELDKLK
jgi:phosphate transport system substrate-binding protein